VTKGVLVVIVGATGVGKTAVSLTLARELDCAIVSCDSRQIYRELHIGVASPSPEQLAQARHYFIGTHSIEEHYSAGQFETDALEIIQQELTVRRSVLMVGGSMLYADAVCKGIDAIPNIDSMLRAELQQFYHTEGIEAVRRKLWLLDRKYYGEVDLKNAKRMLHALEVCITTGKPFSELRTQQVKQRPFKIVKIGLNMPREELYAGINSRVLCMMEQGLEQEARALYGKRHLNALNTVGYKELFAYFDGNISKEQAVEKIQQNTRRYAKKQLTWLRRDTEIQWFHPQDEASILTCLKTALLDFD
jgi:tRNA dimethylallyltransferase